MILQAQKVSSLVCDRLNCARMGGSVHSVFERTVNILGDGPGGPGAWVSIHSPDVAMHPHAVLVEPARAGASASPLPGAFVGERARLTGTEIVLGDGRMAVRLGGAGVWSPGPLPARSTRRAQESNAAETIRDWLKGEVITSPFLRGASNEASVERALGKRCEAIKRNLVTAWRLGDAAGVALAMMSAVGLGAGLTPSGDDFVVGFLGAARLSACGNSPRCRLSRYLRIERSMTTLPSFFMLEGALAGLLPEPLSCLLCAIADEDPHRVLHSAGRLARLGATSGQDMLAGVICYLEAATAAGDLG
jgi:hypothetical protein